MAGCVVRGLEKVLRWLEVGAFRSKQIEDFQIVVAAEGAGCGRSADSLSLGHNGIKLITSQCDRV